VSILDRTTISMKLITMVSFLLLTIAVLGGFALNRLSAVNGVASHVGDKWLQGTGELANVNYDMMNTRRLSLQHLMAKDSADRASVEKQMVEARQEVAERLGNYKKLIESDEERRLFEAVSVNWDRYQGTLPELLALSRVGDSEGAAAVLNTRLRPIGNDATKAMDALTAYNVTTGAAESKRGHHVHDIARTLILGVMGAAVLLGAFTAFVMIRGINKQLSGVITPMGQLSNGDLSAEVPYRGMRTEVGRIADAVQVFKDALIEKQRLDEAGATYTAAKVERGRKLDEMMKAFEIKVGALTQGLSAAATEMEATAHSMTGTAEDASRRTVAASAATEEASANVQTVAGAAEELSASIREIAGQVSQASDIAGRAVDEAQATDATVQELAQAASRIGEVVQFISSIASQTNLLALNATIEAARAGEAGRGFAVVASEVKALANQTAKATEDIAAQITAIQGSTQGAVTAIRRISGTIMEVNGIASAIAAAVEEQRAATQEIARNVQEAATGTSEVSTNVAGLEAAASSTGSAAAQVLSAAGELSQQSEILNQEVGRFLADVKAA
jgi:methyl-accepting chemotaxis protein